MFHLDVFKKIMRLHIGVSQSDNITMFKLLNSIYPINIHRYSSQSKHNGWIIPDDWKVKKALIKKNGEILFDGKDHPLAVIGNSTSFSGILSKESLHKHVFYRKELPDAYNYHCVNYYRPWVKEWGFCIPYNTWKGWSKNGSYEIELKTENVKGEMLVGECIHKGKSKETIIFNAHTCHPCQFNDDLSGVAVILAIFNWLSKQNTNYTYKGILAPEHLGSIFYLANMNQEALNDIKMGSFIEMVGLNNNLILQQSFTGNTLMDRIAENALKLIDPKLRVSPFRKVVGNDEVVWDSPGIEIPFISISRCYDSPKYYKQYHTNEDNFKINSENKLHETFVGLKKIINIFEKDHAINKEFKGLIALSNPEYNLYVDRRRPGERQNLSEGDLKMGELQDVIMRFFNGKYSIFELADKFEVPFDTMYDYVKKFKEKGLVSLIKKLSLDSYNDPE